MFRVESLLMELVLEDVQFTYDRGLPTEKVALESFSLRVHSGEFVSVVGRTGSGKTTLGLIMAGLLNPDAGHVSVKECSKLPHSGNKQNSRRGERVDVVMVFQFPESQFFEEDVFREVAFGPSRLGLGEEELRRRVTSAMQKMKLDVHRLSFRSTWNLSEGEKRKVAIASALSCEPHFLILDEPAISLDWEATSDIFEILTELRHEGVSVIVMTHDVESALTYSDKVAVLAGGRLAASGRLRLDEVYRCLAGPECVS